MTAPVGVQLRRTKGWRMPSHTKSVTRATKFGNPYRIDEYRKYWPDCTDEQLRAMAVSDFEGLVDGKWDLEVGVLKPIPPAYPTVDEIIAELGGWNLACTCPLDGPCHRNVLLRVANP